MAKLSKHQKEIADKTVELKDGRIVKVGQWLGIIALKLPQSFRYKKGSKKGQLVDHFIELIEEFDRGGRKAVLKYVSDCYDLLDSTIKKTLSTKKNDTIDNLV